MCVCVCDGREVGFRSTYCRSRSLHEAVAVSLVSEADVERVAKRGTRSMDGIWTLVVCVGVVCSAVPGSTQDSSR